MGWASRATTWIRRNLPHGLFAEEIRAIGHGLAGKHGGRRYGYEIFFRFRLYQFR